MTEYGPHDDHAWNELLRASVPAPPVDDVDWSALHARVTAGAGPLLRRRAITWWQLLGGRSSRGIRAAGAAIALAMLLLTVTLMPERPPTRSSAPAFRTIEEELAADLPGSVALIAGSATDDVLEALLLYDEGAW